MRPYLGLCLVTHEFRSADGTHLLPPGEFLENL
jgi:hypothetical protein